MHHEESAGETKQILNRIEKKEHYIKKTLCRADTSRYTPGIFKGTGRLILTSILVLCLLSGFVNASGTGSLTGQDGSTILSGDNFPIIPDGQPNFSDILSGTDEQSSQPAYRETQAASPIQPHEFYGTVTVAGSPALVGSIICATINGEERGSITTTVSGQYGSQNWLLPRLSVIAADESEVGATIHFCINGEEADQTATYVAGATTNLPLTQSTTTYTITATAGTGGTISPTGATTVICGADQTFTITPNAGYTIADVTVDGSSEGAISTYTFPEVTENHTIEALFTVTPPESYTITPISATGGTISPATVQSVSAGGSKTFTITANSCYTITDVIIDSTTHLGAKISPYSYTFSNVQENHTIKPIFTIKTYTLTATTGFGGTISPSGATTVTCGADQTFTITPNIGYTIADVMVDGSSEGAISTYTFTDVTGDHTIEALFTDIPPESYTITPISATGGTISPATVQSVSAGGSKTFTITANTCYTITDVIINSTTHLGSQTSPYSYTFPNVQENCTIQPVFSAKTYIITATAGTGGSISPVGATTVVCGSDVTYTITPTTGYVISELLIDGVTKTPAATYTFSDVTADHTIHVGFTIGSGFAITATATSGGTISPAGVTQVSPGGSQIYAITPAAGNAIQDVLVDGASIGGVSTYTFSNVQADHTIHAVFTAGDTCTITPFSAMGGTIAPSAPHTVPVGSDVSFVMTADSCHTITDVIIDGSTHLGPQTSPYTYTFKKVQINHTIRPVFSSKVYTIMATAGTGGSISPSGEITVICGLDVTFTVTPGSGYDYTDLVVDGQSVGALRSYTFTAVTADHTIYATFTPQPTSHTIIATAEGGGIISPSGAVVVAEGGEKTFTIGTDSCYELKDVLVDGQSVGVVRSYTFSSVTTDHTIHVTVSRLEYRITASAGTGGSISPVGTISFWCGTDQTFTITSNAGYHIKDVLVDSESVGPVRSYTFSVIGKDHTISATFEENIPGEYVISATAGEGGTITPSGAVMVRDGDDITFTITPDTAYGVSYLVVDGESLGQLNEYTFYSVVADHTIDARFSPIYPAPVADLSGMPLGGPAPLTVEFFDLSRGYITMWSWQFSQEGGEVHTSSEQNPVKTFTKDGYWDVSLSVTDIYGRVDQKVVSDYIYVGSGNLPYASFTVSPDSGIAPLTVTFTDTSTGQISAWNWDFGDDITSAEQNPVHIYEQAGDYIATLQVTNAYGSTKASRKIVVSNEPHESSLSMPGGVFYRKAGETTWQYHQIQPLSEQFNCWEYTTSYEPSPQRLNSPYVVTYEDYPQSAFTLAITEYNKELILDDTYQFRYCIADGQKLDQLSFSIPDETNKIVQAVYYESDDDTFHLSFVSPINGATIPPGKTNIRVQAEGTGLDPDHVFYINPSGAQVSLAYNQQSGLFEGEFDATPYLGQTITLTALAQRTGGYPDVRAEIQVIVMNQPVIADFIGSPLLGTAPLTVAFMDRSRNNPVSWLWMFGDGSISDKENPTHIYEKPGIYSVNLTVQNAVSEETAIKTDYITVEDPGLIADFEVIPRSGTKPLTIAAYDKSIGDIVSWEWTFAHDSGSTPIQSFEQDPIITLDKGGNWDVILTVTDSLGMTATRTEKNYIHIGGPQPVLESPVFSADPLAGNQPLETTFTVISPDTARQWYWNFGDETHSYEKEPVHTYEKAGSYSPQLTIWSDENSATTVLANAITVKKTSDNPVALFTADPVCFVAPGKVWFTDESIGGIVSWAWDFGDGSVSDKQNPVHKYTSGGIQTVTLTVTDKAGKQDTLTRDTYITVYPQGGGTPGDALLKMTRGTINQGQTLTDTFIIDSSVNSFSQLLNWPGSILGFSLIYPDGTRIITDPASPTGTTSSNVHYSAGSTYAVYDVGEPVPGEYTFEVTAYETGGDEPYSIMAVVDTGVYIEAALAADTIYPGTPIEVTARLLSEDTPITDPSLSATCETPGGSVYEIPLILDATFSYSGRFTDTITPGIYTIIITTDSDEVQRIAIFSCESEGYLIEVVADANGSITPKGDTYVSAGETPCFSITPNTGYRIADLKVDDVSVGPQTTYQFDPVHADHTMEAFFTSDTPEFDFVLNLVPGWNLVSILRYPIIGLDTLGRLFGGIDNDGHSIFMYNASVQMWDLPLESHPVIPLEAYFVYSEEYVDIGIMFASEQIAPQVLLMPAWNLIGYTGEESEETRLYLSSLQDAWTFILGFDAEKQIYEETIIRGGTGPFSDTRPMNRGKGYWIYCEEERLFIPS